MLARFALLLLALASPALAAARAPRHPVAAGTFIQWYLVRDWDDARWQAEFHTLKDVGMDTIVFAPTLDGKPGRAYYPTRLPGYSMPPDCPDLVDACLRNAERAGFRVFLGLNFHDDWWRKAASDPAWLLAQMEEGNRGADELYAAYARRYPRAFHGWYWVWEVDNLNFRTPEQIATLARAIDTNVRHLKRLDPRKPVMLCPFMNAALGSSADYRRMWERVFAACALGRGDVFCPQDCVGAGGLRLAQVPEWFAALREAVRTKPGLRFWADTETFDQRDWTSAPIGRVVAQMRAVQPYVERCLTFAYSHYDSPGVAPAGFHRAYRAYVRSGRLDATPPGAPRDVRAQASPDGSIVLRWRPPASARDLCGYRVYRGGEPVAHLQAARRPGEAVVATTWTDTKAAGARPSEYAVGAYDFAGNASERRAAENPAAARPATHPVVKAACRL
ncbi:MAG: DUF4434 domain-containing protein [Chthonomonadales bacterium]|nr:DUF4434 domain-containing protein [Chthonomonadales bacterium]